MVNRDFVAIGTSAGGFEALRSLAKQFPENFPASILITIHLPLQIHSNLDQLLTQVGPLPAAFAKEGEATKKGHILHCAARAAPAYRWRTTVARDRPS